MVVATLVGGILTAAPGAAASSSTAQLGTCTKTSATTSDPYGHRFSVRRFCGTATAPIYASTNTNLRKGTLNAGNNWFLCYRIGSYNDGGPYGGSSYWYYTHGDTLTAPAHNSWGFVAGSYINASDPTITSSIPQCTFVSVPR